MKCDSVSLEIENESHRNERAAHGEHGDDQDLQRRGEESIAIVVIVSIGRIGRGKLNESGAKRFLDAVEVDLRED
jgi:hypothetical protein